MYARKDLGTKILQSVNLPEKNITVGTVQLEDPLIVYEITATVAGHTEIQRHSIGVSGTNPVQGPAMSASELQAALDGYRQSVADTVAWKAAMDAASSAVQ